MKNNKFTIGVIVTTVVLLLGGIALAKQMTSNSSPELTINEQAEASVISDPAHDWGEIMMDEGDQETIFTIKNEGSAPLQLYGINTSCMCTTAQLIMGNQQSPAFGMHNKSKYIFEVPPQQEAQLKVVFDPAYHGPSGVGPINRQVQIATNDPANPMLQFMVTGMVRR
jgi:hypothetical protein